MYSYSNEFAENLKLVLIICSGKRKFDQITTNLDADDPVDDDDDDDSDDSDSEDDSMLLAELAKFGKERAPADQARKVRRPLIGDGCNIVKTDL